MTITPEKFTEKLNELRAGIAEDRLISTQFNDPVQPEVLVLETLIRSYDENAALRDRVEALEWFVECEDLWHQTNTDELNVSPGAFVEIAATLNAAIEVIQAMKEERNAQISA